MNHDRIANRNRTAWEWKAYEAWVAAYGAPIEAAADLIRDPRKKLKRILPRLGDQSGQRIANPLGSHGRTAVALALLGAEVTVVDISESNLRYAVELAEAADVSIRYELGDFIRFAQSHGEEFDWAVMELGIVHYFADMDAFVAGVRHILKPGGRMLLNEFHPLLKKSIVSTPDGIALEGDYFSTGVEAAETPYATHLKDEGAPDCLVRRWTLGEIVTGFAQGGFHIEALDEQPSWEIAELPGTFTLVARR